MSSKSETFNQAAMDILKATSFFGDAPQDLLQDLASKMTLVQVEDGHIFFHEGDEMDSILILESGEIKRTKFSVPTLDSAAVVAAESGDERDYDGEMRKSFQSQLQKLPIQERSSSLAESSVLVDTFHQRGKVSGLLHNFKQGAKAFSTVSAVGPVKAWLIEGKDFRECISSSPARGLHVMFALSRELRNGSKSLRTLITKSKTGADDSDSTTSKRVCRVLCYDTSSWVSEGFQEAVKAFNELHGVEGGYEIKMDFIKERLSEQTATLAAGYDAICLFVNDNANATVLRTLSLLNVGMIALRCAGFDRVDFKAARAYNITVARVPAYSPYAVAEMAVSLLMAVNRKILMASNRVKMANFTLDSGLLGMDIYGKTVGIMGTGKIGSIVCNIMLGFGAKVICFDVYENEEVKKAGGVYVTTKDEVFARSDILFLMMPLLPSTEHTINDETLAKLKKGVLLINTSRGGLIDTKALLRGLQDGHIGGVGLDVYENESDYFYHDWSGRNIPDMDLVALLGNNKVILTAHQAFFTQEAIQKIIQTTMDNVHDYYFNNLKGPAHPNNCITPQNMK